MDLETKWIMIALALIIISGVVTDTLSDYYRTQCRVTAMQKGLSLEDINKVCN